MVEEYFSLATLVLVMEGVVRMAAVAVLRVRLVAGEVPLGAAVAVGNLALI